MSTFILLVLGVIALVVTGNKDSGHGDHADKYICTHHPEVVRDQPGTCPSAECIVEKH